MARYDHLPIWKDAVALAMLLEEAVRRFPRSCPEDAGSTEPFDRLRTGLTKRNTAPQPHPHPESIMRRNLFALVVLLALLATGLEAHAVCTAANPNANVAESTPTSAFTDNGNGTVTHNLTGLIWKRCAEGQTWNGSTCTGDATLFSWANALIQAKNASFADQTDWRLPNLKELESIVESCGLDPSINQTLFPATPASYFWSGSTYVPSPAYAWIVDFYNGNTLADLKTLSFDARLVRGGQSFDTFDATSDNVPSTFSFVDQSGVALSTLITSAPVQISGINTTTPWTASGGTACVSSGNNCSCDVATFATSGSIQNNQYLCARHTSSANYSTATNTLVTVGGVSDTFTSTTLALIADPGPQASLTVNGTTGDEVSAANPVAVTYRLRGCQGQELFLVLNAPPMGIVWSYLTAAGQWVPLPANLADITPFNAAGPADGSYPLFMGNVPAGDYELYLGCDFVKNGHLDYLLGAINGVYGHSVVHVR